MNVAQAINANHRRAQRERDRKACQEIRRMNAEIQRLQQRLQRKAPYCEICGSRFCESPQAHLGKS